MDCIIDSHHGIYIPQFFSEEYGDYLTESEKQDLSSPDNEFYWETWDDVLANFEIDINGIKYRLHQDCDLFLISDDDFCDDCGEFINECICD